MSYNTENTDSNSDCLSSYSDDSSLSDPIGLIGSVQRNDKIISKSNASTQSVMAKVKALAINEDYPKELQYINLVNEAYSVLSKENKNKEKKKIPLDVKREAGSKTSINIAELAEVLNRNQDHLMNFIFESLTTNGSVNMGGRLTIKGNYSRNQIQEVLKLFIEKFVACKSCEKAENTEIVKENRIYFLKCNNCNSKRSIPSVKEGYYSN